LALATGRGKNASTQPARAVHRQTQQCQWEHPEGEWEWEQHEGQPEWEHPGSHPYASTEWEEEYATEADPFFGRLKKLAKRFAVPLVTKALGTMIPGAGPLIGLASSLIKEGESEVSAMEAHLFGTNEQHPEVSNTEVAHEAALTEVMAHEAMAAQSEGEAEAVLTGALPITITIMGGRRSLRPVIPMLAQANGRLVRTLRRQGPAGRQLLRTVPAIQRRTIAGLRAAARRGQPITGPLAVQTMAAAARRVLGSPQQVQRALVRNRMLRRRLAPWYSSRNQSSNPLPQAIHRPRDLSDHHVPTRTTALSSLTSIGASVPAVMVGAPDFARRWIMTVPAHTFSEPVRVM
jgi:hypothetical protein